MKRTITLRYLFTLCVMTLISAFYGGNLASAEEVTFVYTSSSNFARTTIGDITVEMTNASWYSTRDCVKVPSGDKITVSCKETHKITQIVFELSSANRGSVTASSGGTFKNNNTWTSGSDALQNVVFNNKSSSQYRFKTITVTYEANNVSEPKVDPDFTISPDKTLDCLESYTVEAVAKDRSGNKLNGTIEYSISPESGDFTFNKETGVFKAGLSAGTYEVTAEYSGTTGYNPDRKTCTITVADPGVRSSKDYRMVTNKNQLWKECSMYWQPVMKKMVRRT